MAVVDDGVDGSHLELAPNYVRASLLFYCYLPVNNYGEIDVCVD